MAVDLWPFSVGSHGECFKSVPSDWQFNWFDGILASSVLAACKLDFYIVSKLEDFVLVFHNSAEQ
ncbi:hypothetical protein SLEP1_g54174 [Rubroshorea leprosula]|uniref:Uncharacterized protein n=1 Tax=Rubroshorea leprosula TaxID=152421 RepID=A0AAV5MBK0_9ROSI|nr:hypothetical protein SLEP1_g54174 [Rubroshorea leprosula]